MKPFKSIREGKSVTPGVTEINDVPEDPLSYVEIKPKKAKVVKKDKVMGEEKEMQDKESDKKAKDKALQRAMNATPRKPAGEYERKVTSYLKKKYNESIDLTSIWEGLKPEQPVIEEEAFNAEAHKKELDRLMAKSINAHTETTRLIKAKAPQEEISKAYDRHNAVKQEIAVHKAKVPAGPAPKPGSAAHYYASKKPGEYTGD
ncbi:hypothetical protein UFOVP242_184 [uncultured Caudovirales phage]|uniref:Uncharacterized protein n=1 Tax=uncultured Caudovirales phage TaxID=2100421 RepID=A0A6J7WW52_9CAUD|nr:hypothetical protein UFOVP242_184 [uncultured Caudovirales phage]